MKNNTLMTGRRVLVIAPVCIAIGVLLGVFGSQYYALVNEFPRAMNFRAAMVEALGSVPPSVALKLLDSYEADVRRQIVWYERLGFWRNELVQIELRRYILFTMENNPDLAGKALTRAADIQKHGALATAEDVEVLKEVAVRLYGPKDGNISGPR